MYYVEVYFMRDFNYSLLKDLKWDSEIVSYLTAIHEAKGKQELYLKQQPEKLNILPNRGVAQLVARMVRDSITVLCVVNSKNAENP